MAPTSYQRKDVIGVIGDWRNYFTDDVRQWYIDIAGETFKKGGY